MTALAFLFAVFLARPCPFYILDEVEAALDDLNLDRFLALLRRYSDRAQFIVITHQKRTMEAADWLFGVSMGGDGVSKVLSRRLPAEQERMPEVAEVADIFAPSWRASGAICSSSAARAHATGATVLASEPDRADAGDSQDDTLAGAQRGGLFRRLRESMAKTRQALGSEIQATLFGVLDEHTWERLEEALIMADVGASTTASVVATLETRSRRGRARGRRGAERASDRPARAGDASRRRAHRHSRASDGDHGRRRQRHRQDDDDRQARVAPAPRARTHGPARRRRHVPRRGERAVARLGRARRMRDRHRTARLGSGRGGIRGDRAGRARRASTS